MTNKLNHFIVKSIDKYNITYILFLENTSYIDADRNTPAENIDEEWRANQTNYVDSQWLTNQRKK